MSQNLLSAAVVIGALRVNKMICFRYRMVNKVSGEEDRNCPKWIVWTEGRSLTHIETVRGKCRM